MTPLLFAGCASRQECLSAHPLLSCLAHAVDMHFLRHISPTDVLVGLACSAYSLSLDLTCPVQMRESDKRKGSKRKGHMNDDNETPSMPHAAGARRPGKQSRR